MTSVPETVTMFAFVLLGLFFAPQEVAEFHVSLLDRDGYSESMIMRRIEDGFAVHDRRGAGERRVATVRREGSGARTYIWEENGQSRERCDFSALKDMTLREGRTEEISFRDKAVRLTKAGEAVFVDPVDTNWRLIVHW